MFSKCSVPLTESSFLPTTCLAIKEAILIQSKRRHFSLSHTWTHTTFSIRWLCIRSLTHSFICSNTEKKQKHNSSKWEQHNKTSFLYKLALTAGCSCLFVGLSMSWLRINFHEMCAYTAIVCSLCVCSVFVLGCTWLQIKIKIIMTNVTSQALQKVGEGIGDTSLQKTAENGAGAVQTWRGAVFSYEQRRPEKTAEGTVANCKPVQQRDLW